MESMAAIGVVLGKLKGKEGNWVRARNKVGPKSRRWLEVRGGSWKSKKKKKRRRKEEEEKEQEEEKKQVFWVVNIGQECGYGSCLRA